MFDEWEFCASDFTSDGKYIRFKDNEVNATFSCPKCTPSSTGQFSQWFTYRKFSHKRNISEFLCVHMSLSRLELTLKTIFLQVRIQPLTRVKGEKECMLLLSY